MSAETETVPVPSPRSPAVRLFAAGAEIGRRYEIRSVLGTGGSASVYAAWDRDLKRLVALKALRHDRMTETALKRFRREVAVARDADSPRLVRVYDVGEAGETVFLTMELVEGESLRQRLGGDPLEPGEALRIAKEVLHALGDLHRLGIVHRDVKPGNILLGAGGLVKLADFGLARHWDGGDTRATETEGLVGTMEYLAPEQALGRPVDARTDLYAFGVVLYELLSGRVPFSSESVLGNVVARLREKAPDVRRANPSVPAWLAGVVARTLERDPGDRYATAGALLADLEAGRATGVAWRRRRVRGALAAAALLVAAGLAGAFFSMRGLRARVPPYRSSAATAPWESGPSTRPGRSSGHVPTSGGRRRSRS
ncbi:MAG: serine/threonine protein kinase [Holophagales bacterium]|nr:serine/threonine protein kinase [Holophagales bacterium]